MGIGMNGVLSVWSLRAGSFFMGLFIPRRKLAIISRASSIRLFFCFIPKLLCELFDW
jgi:hypothetical protein